MAQYQHLPVYKLTYDILVRVCSDGASWYQISPRDANAKFKTAGGANIALGYQAGDSITTGTGNLLIGYDADTPAATTSNILNIGGTVFGDLSTDNVRIGGSGAVSAGPLIASPPTVETVAAAATITADACGTVKKIQSTGNPDHQHHQHLHRAHSLL